MEPYIARISNMAGATAQDSFAIGLTRLEGDADCRVEFDGQMIGETEEVNLQQISTLYPTSRDFTGQVAYILMQIIREVAARNDLVGRGLLITVMPRTSIKEGEASGLAAGVLMEGEQSFLYVPPDADKGIQYGPGCICHGVQVTDYKSGPPEAFSGLDGNPALDG